MSWRSPSYAGREGDDQPFDLDVPLRLPAVSARVPLADARARPFCIQPSVTHWKIYRGCCLYTPQKYILPRGAQDRRRCISPSDSNWHIIRQKFPPCLFILLLFYPIVTIIIYLFRRRDTAGTIGDCYRCFYINALFLYVLLLCTACFPACRLLTRRFFIICLQLVSMTLI